MRLCLYYCMPGLNYVVIILDYFVLSLQIIGFSPRIELCQAHTVYF